MTFQLDREIYNESFWEQLRRYGNPEEAMGLYFDRFSEGEGDKKIEIISGGPRLMLVVASIPGVKEIVMHDINQGPLDASREYLGNPPKIIRAYPILQAEMDFLSKRGFDTTLDPSLFRLYLAEEMPKFENYFNGSMAEEVLLHPPSDDPEEHLATILISQERGSLKKGGRFVFSVYPTNVPEHGVSQDCLLNHFNRLATDAGMRTDDFYDYERGWIHIDRVAKHLRSQAPDVFEKNKKRFWLGDLSRIKTYSPKEISTIAENGFKIIGLHNIPGGMFPFATRFYYVLEKI